jgi:hypothetical protein
MKGDIEALATVARAYTATALSRKVAGDNVQYLHDTLADRQIKTGDPVMQATDEERRALERASRHYNSCTDAEIEAEEKLRRAALDFCGEDPAIADDPL